MFTWLQRVPPQNGEEGGKEDDEVAQHLQPHRQPPVGNDAGLKAGLVQVHLLLQLLCVVALQRCKVVYLIGASVGWNKLG